MYLPLALPEYRQVNNLFIDMYVLLSGNIMTRSYFDRFSFELAESNLRDFDGYVTPSIGINTIPAGLTPTNPSTGIYLFTLDKVYGGIKSLSAVPKGNAAIIAVAGNATELNNADVVEVRCYNTSGVLTDPGGLFVSIRLKNSKSPVGF
jgi:hypothetical protein